MGRSGPDGFALILARCSTQRWTEAVMWAWLSRLLGANPSEDDTEPSKRQGDDGIIPLVVLPTSTHHPDKPVCAAQSDSGGDSGGAGGADG